MPAEPETPEGRAEREGTPTEAIELVEPDPTPTFGRKAAGSRGMVASAARIRLDDRKAIAGVMATRQAWQSTSWDYFAESPEIGFTLTLAANLMSKMRLFAAVRPDQEEAPVPVDSEDSGVDEDTAKIAMETLDRLRSLQGGQAALIRDATLNLEVAGEGYLHAHEDPETGEEDWQIRSVDELVAVEGRFGLRTGTGSMRAVALPEGDLVVRIWERDPRFSSRAFCAMRRVLTEAEALLLLSREIIATAQSRLSNGVFIVPSEATFGPLDPTSTDPNGDVFEAEWQESMVTPIGQPGSASAVVPFLMRIAAEYCDKVRHIKVSRDLDATLDARIEGRVLRIARGLNMPVEATTGLMATTFANAIQVRQSQFDSHIEPRAILLVDCFTAGYFQPALVEAGVPLADARRIFVWFDPTDLIAKDDQSEKAREANEDYVISDAARRKYQGYNEADAPTDEELLRRVALEGAKSSPQIVAQLLRQFFTDLGNLEIPTSASSGGRPALTAASNPAATDLGRRLTAIDIDLRTRVSAAAEQAMRRALEKAGNRVLSKAGKDSNGQDRPTRRVAGAQPLAAAVAAVGPAMVAALGLTDAELLEGAFDGVISDFGAWVRVSLDSALVEVEKVFGKLPAATREELAVRSAMSIPAAQQWLREQLVTLAGDRLYGGGTVANVGEVDALSTIPAGIARGALAVAGGATATETAGGALVNELGLPVMGLATGPIVSGAGYTAGGVVEAYQWEYGPALRADPFEPHRRLDGQTFESWSDPILETSGGFPAVSHAHPGDHRGCLCSGIPVWVDAAGEVTQAVA